MQEQVSLLENTGSEASSTVSGSPETAPSSAGIAGPSITISTEREEYVIGGEELLMYLSMIQTLLLVAVTIQQLRQ